MGPDAPIRDHWVRRSPGDGPEARAGELLRQARRSEPLGQQQLAAVRARLGGERRGAARRWVWQLAIGVVVLLGGGALVAAKTGLLPWFPRPVDVHPKASSPEPYGAPARHRRGRARVSAALEPAPAVAPSDPASASPAPTLETARPAAPPRVRATRETPRAISPPAVEPEPSPAERPAPIASPLAEESALLTTALRKLRQEHDPRGALALLDQHNVRFAGGPLRTEAELVRVEALLQDGRRGDALRLLDPLKAPWSGRRRDLLVSRGELRAQAGRCAEAMVDFGVVLSGETRDDAIAERALHGRASCRSRRGDATGARADLEQYLARFPEGRFAADARRSLLR
jgi:hypothetical protein